MPFVLTNQSVGRLVEYFSENNIKIPSLITFILNFAHNLNIFKKLNCSSSKLKDELHDSVRYCNDRSIIITIEIDENTPLLRSSCGKKLSATGHGNLNSENKGIGYCDFRVLGITVLLVGGITIASYLMVVDSRLPAVGFSLDLVNRDVWSQVLIPLGKRINDTKVLHVLVVQTGGSICMQLDSCVDILRDMQKSQGNASYEIPYNFLIGGNSQTYEVRGWNHESGLDLLSKQSSLVIGFIGNYTSLSLTDGQSTSALSLINESVRRKILHSSYRVFGLRNLTISHNDGEALFDQISKWKRFETILYIL